MSSRLLVLTLLSVLAAACSTTPRWPHPLTPLDALPWPTPAAGAVCETPAAPALPSLPPQTGRLRVENAVRLLPAGVVTTLDIVAMTAAGAFDPDARGALVVDLGGRGQVIDVTPLTDGRALARVRLEGRGPVPLGLRAGALTGTSPVMVYETRLPVWELAVDQVQLDGLAATAHEDRRLPARLTVNGVDFDTTVRLHGGTSRDYPKKSYRFDLAEGRQLDGRRRLILRAEWNDKTMLRNWLAHDVFRRGTWLPTPEARYVHFRVNGRYYGLMLQVERIDGAFLATRRLDPEGDLYESDPPLGGRVGDLTPLPPEQYAVVYDHHAGAADHADLRRLIEEVLTLEPDEFEAALPREVAVDDLLVYLAAMAAVQNHDHVRKNYYLYRAKALPRGWVVLPWDLDLTFGHMWSEGEDVLGERITTDADPFVGSLIDGQGQHNALIERVLAYPELRARMVAMTQRIAATTMAPDAVERRIAAALCDVAPDLAADERKRAANAEYPARLTEIRQFVAARGAVLRAVR